MYTNIYFLIKWPQTDFCVEKILQQHEIKMSKIKTEKYMEIRSCSKLKRKGNGVWLVIWNKAKSELDLRRGLIGVWR